MRILVVNGVSFIGGAEHWILHLVGQLGPRGHAIEVAHHPASDLGERARRAGAEAWVPRGGFERRALTGARTTIAALAETIRRDEHDVVVSSSRSDLKPAGAAARRAGHPGVVARLNSGWSIDALPLRRGLRWWRHRRYHRRLVHLAATNSRAGKADLVARGFVDADRIEVIYNGVDLARFDPDRVPRGSFRAELGVPAEAPLIVSLARFAPDRGQEAEVVAVRRLLSARPDLRAAFIGSCRTRDRSFLDRLRSIAAGPEAERIRFLDHREDVPEILADADVLLRVMTVEGLANVALEAMAMGVPVVAGDLAGMPEAIVEGETGWLVPPAYASGIERALATALDLGPERRAAMATAGRARIAALFSLERMGDAYERLFARAVAERERDR